MMHTKSATPLEAVMVEPSRGGRSHVWLRKNIVEVAEAFEGAEVPTWEADELHFMVDGTPSAESIQDAFGELWEAHAQDSRTDRQLMLERVNELQAALAELGELIVGGK